MTTNTEFLRRNSPPLPSCVRLMHFRCSSAHAYFSIQSVQHQSVEDTNYLETSGSWRQTDLRSGRRESPLLCLRDAPPTGSMGSRR